MVKISNDENMNKLYTMKQLALQQGDYALVERLKTRLKPVVKKAGGKSLKEYLH